MKHVIKYKMARQLQIQVVNHFPHNFWRSYESLLFITKMTILLLINWSYKSSPNNNVHYRA